MRGRKKLFPSSKYVWNTLSNIKPLLVLFGTLFIACSEKQPENTTQTSSSEIERFLPFQSIDLNDRSGFKEPTDNWKIVGDVFVDRSKDGVIIPEEGQGVLVNLPAEGMNQNLFTGFEHGDIELELDVMMPLHSNSGLYFQGRYEVQLFDSWGVKDPQYGDMGGIYQRWDESRGKGKEGFEGHRPLMNAAKSPGLWQHIRVIFHAPRFDAAGLKTANALFEEVWLNGVLVQKNVEVTGPTQAAAFQNEKAQGPLMIQGDHGAVAFKNMHYKLYNEKAISFKDLTMREYESTGKVLPNLDSLLVVREIKTDSISPAWIANDYSQRILKYSGNWIVPESGDYLFDMKVNGGAVLLIAKDSLINLNGDYNIDSLGIGKIFLQKGPVPFELIYNKHTPWIRGFQLYVEGPEMQKYSIQLPSTVASDQEGEEDYSIKVRDEPIAQRSFWMHEGTKRTHCISVGLPRGIHYTYDLEAGSLLQLWEGEFMDAALMWHSRGEKQLGAPLGFIVSLHGDPEFAFLKDDKGIWPDNLASNPDFKQLGYEFDEQGMPTFLNEINGTRISNTLVPATAERTMTRRIEVVGDKEIWYKVADGASIKALQDGTFIINDESYFIDFSGSPSLEPMIRNSNGKAELLVKIPAGNQQLEYNITW